MDFNIGNLGLIDDEVIVLDRASLQLAMLDHPEHDLDTSFKVLDQIQDQLALTANNTQSLHQQAQALVNVIAGRFAFTGNRHTYDDASNADLIQVIIRRRSLPVSLTILYVSAARAMGWQASPLNTPGHMLMALGVEPFLLLDPFSINSKHPQPNDYGSLKQTSVKQFNPMTNCQTLARLLNNQASRAAQAKDYQRALILNERITAIAPNEPHTWWEKARLEIALKRPDLAKQSLYALLEVTAQTSMPAQVIEAINSLPKSSA